MKNGLVIWNILLTAIAGYLLFAQMRTKKTNDATFKAIAGDTAAVNQPTRIAYFEMDSIEAHYEMVKDVQAEIQVQEKQYSNELAGLDMQYQKKIQQYRNLGDAMTQDDYQKMQVDLKRTEDYLKGQKQEMDQRYQVFITQRNLSLKKKIEDFIAKYNSTRNYTYILAYEPGLFYYRDTAYNITSDVIKGLNEDYKTEKKK